MTVYGLGCREMRPGVLDIASTSRDWGIIYPKDNDIDY